MEDIEEQEGVEEDAEEGETEALVEPDTVVIGTAEPEERGVEVKKREVVDIEILIVYCMRVIIELICRKTKQIMIITGTQSNSLNNN